MAIPSKAETTSCTDIQRNAWGQPTECGFLEVHGETWGSRVVRLDVVLPENVASIDPNQQWLAADSFHLRIDDAEAERLGAMHDINLRIEEIKNSPLTYAHGVWTLRGYFAVEGVVGLGQGIVAHSLVPIPLSNVVE